MKADASLWTWVSRSTPGRYALAVAITTLGLLARRVLDPFLGYLSPYTPLYPGIAFLSIFVGPGPAILSTILGLLGVTYWFIPPRGSFAIGEAAHMYGNLTFLIVCACIIAAGEMSRRSRAKLERAENLFESFLDNSPGVEFLKDEEGRYIYANRTAETRIGAAFVGKTDDQLFPASYAARLRSNDQDVLNENKALEFVETTEGPDGERTWLTVKFPVTDEKGRKFLGGKAIDLTEQRRAEDDVRRLQQENARQMAAELEAMRRLQEVANRCVRSEDDFQGSLDAILDAAIFLTGAEKGNLQLLNPTGDLAVAAQRGFQEPFLKFFSPIKEQASVSRAAMLAKERVIAEDITQSKIFAGTSSLQVLLDEGVRALQATPLVSSTGKLLGMIVTHFSRPHRPGERELRLMDLLARQAADYLERKQAEEAIRAASGLLQRFLDAVPTGLTRCSRDLRYLTVNPAYAAIAGLPVEQIVGRPIIDVMGAEGWEKIQPYVERVLRGEQVEYEMPVPFPGRGTLYIHVAYTPERGPSGEVVGWVGSVMEITEFKRLEAQLQKVEKLAAAGQLAASLAHEINNPLSTVTNALYLLKVHPDLDDEAMDLVKTAGSELERVARIVKQSLSYYREGTTPKELDLGASVEESLQIYGEKFQRSGVEMRKKIVLKTWMMGFPDEIRQVIDNLLLNALEATPGGGRLAIRVRWSRDWKNQRQGGVRLTIADSGQGIPEEQIAKIFEPFYTTKAERGTGLGLWVVRGIVAKHEAMMKFRSSARHGKSGTVVSILWPSSGWREHIEEAARSGSAA